MSLEIMRRVRFCAGHRLLNHGGKCESLHGHNYQAEFYVTGDQVDDVGRLIDFAQLKKLFKGWIDDNWDHAMLLWDQDRETIAAVQAIPGQRLYPLPFNPSAENLAKYLLEHVCPPLLKEAGVRATKVIIWETQEACAIAHVDANEAIVSRSSFLESADC
ncbi:MAG: 6-carboxytetrahydropterin synthase [Planctomycetota bacterium]